ncbi:MAG: metal-dependent transcriptional regulator [Promethearchaeota archaeon]|nr:MAG: metal-dependent transcriptional regulator [Candidatus Lokiarchaeota archaeon]
MLDIDYEVLRKLYKNNSLKVGALAKKLKYPHSTVGSCIKRLENQGYVIYERYKPVVLSEKGRDFTIELKRHAHLLEMLLINELEIRPEDAHSECEKINLRFSCNVINKICERYGHPKSCPCGEEILNSSGCFCEKEN